MSDVNLTDVFVDYVCDTKWEDLDDVTIDRVKCRLIDSFGVLAIGHTSPDTDATVALLQKAGGAEESTIATYGSKIPMAQAAFANSILMRSYDFECIDAEALNDDEGNTAAHISGTTVPAALAVAEALHASGKDLMLALILGDDVTTRALCSTGFSVHDCFDGNGTANILGSTVAAGKLLGLDKEEMKGAFSLGINQMSGTMQNVFEKKITFKVPIALSARAGVFAAQLATCGFGPCLNDSMNGPRGMFQMFYSNPTPEKMLTNLGTRFYADAVIKPWPACRATHASIDATLQACAGKTFTADEIEAVELHVAPGIKSFVGQGFVFGMDKSYQGAFSIDFLCATAILRGNVTPLYEQPEYMTDPAIGAILEKLTIFDDLPKAGDVSPAECVIKLADGTELKARVDMALGDYKQTRLSRDEVLAKYYANIEFSGKVSKENADKIVEVIDHLEDLEDIADLMALIA
ncbi:MAG: MmgE/PrpD family protein [Eggerthellaceae bacterium]|nr:MmgE/PrpD family protein [Eggerthellaceae bacterium]